MTDGMNHGSFLGVVYRRTARTQARLDAARERIVTSALELVAADGYRGVTVASVAERAGVATGTVYRHFASKADLFAEVFRRASQHEVDVLVSASLEPGGDAVERLAAAVEVFARRALRGRRLAYALIAEPVDPQIEEERLRFREAYAEVFAELVREGIANGRLPPQDERVAAAGLVGAIGEALVGPLSPAGATDDVEVFVDGLVALCVRAVGGASDDPIGGTDSVGVTGREGFGDG